MEDLKIKEDKNFFKTIWITEDELLTQIVSEKEIGRDFVENERYKILDDLVLLRNQLNQKSKDLKRVWDTTLFNVHTALMARSYTSKKLSTKFKWDKQGWNVDRQIKMLNNALKEDFAIPDMKANRYYKDWDKFATWIWVQAKVGWDWVYKRPIWQTINPLLIIPDPAWDYFSWNYRYIWFEQIRTEQELVNEWYDVSDLKSWWNWTSSAIEMKKKSQTQQWLVSLDDKWLYDIYIHFTTVWKHKIRVFLWNDCRTILNYWKIQPWNKFEEKNPEIIKFPFAFYYRKPLRDTFFWDRPANYIRDIQLQKAEISNLRLQKMKAELFPMYLYNSDYVKGTDLSFWFNKWVPIKGLWLWWQNVNLQNIIQPIQKDLKIDTSIQVEQLLDRTVEKSTSIWEVVQWTTPDKRETLWTNQLIVSNTDVNLSLNEEIDAIWDEQLIIIWFNSYYENFTSADKKLIYASSSTWEVPISLKRIDFIYEGNLAISTETGSDSETRKRKQALAITQITPFILQDPSINNWYKRNLLRLMASAQWLTDDEIDYTIWKTIDQYKQQQENQLLIEWIRVPVDPYDDDEQHLLEMGNTEWDLEWELHRALHIDSKFKKEIQKKQTPELPPEENWNKWMLNWALNQSMWMVNSELASLNK